MFLNQSEGTGEHHPKKVRFYSFSEYPMISRKILVKWFHEQSEKTIQLLLHSGGAEEPFTLFKTRKLKDNRIWSE